MLFLEEVPAGDMLPVANILSVNTHEYFRAGGPTRRPRAPGRQQGPCKSPMGLF